MLPQTAMIAGEDEMPQVVAASTNESVMKEVPDQVEAKVDAGEKVQEVPIALSRDNVGHYKIGRFACVDVEELVFHATRQRRAYGLGPAVHERKRLWWFEFFDNHFGPPTATNPLIDENVPLLEEAAGEPYGVAILGGYPRGEWQQDKDAARKSLRTSSWAMMFFIITTDVIGPTNAPYAFSTVGLVAGVIIYLVLGLAAYYNSFVLLNLFLRLDSTHFPIHTYGELVEVFLGKAGHYAISIMQILQILLIVGSNNISAAQSITLLTANRSTGPLCFVVYIAIFAVVGLCISVPFRSLRKLSYISSLNVFFTIFICFLSMGVISHTSPNYASAAATYGFTPPFEPIKVSVGTPPGPTSTAVNGAMNAVFGWAGLMIFVEFMNEMRHPWHFWKSFTVSEGVVMFMYLLYGIYVYALQGQYTLPVAYQGVSSYAWQSVGNGISLWCITMASICYLNIGCKIIYWLIFKEVFRGPPLMSSHGLLYWAVLQTASWSLSFVIGTAVPQVQTIQGLVGAAFLLQFTYTFPPLLQLIFDVRADASKEDEEWSSTGTTRRKDTWRMASRWKRGLFGGGYRRIAWKGFHLAFFLTAAATAGLGIWGSSLSVVTAFQQSAATSFGCTAPV